MTFNNLMNRIWLRFIETLNKLSFHLFREDGLGRFRNGDGSLNFATIAQSY